MVNANSIVKVTVLVVSMLMAILLGNWLATDKTTAFIWIAVGCSIMLCIALGSRIWLLIPLLSSVDLSLRIPGQPSTIMLAHFFVLGFSVVLVLMRRLPYRLRWTELETWMLILTVLVIQVYARNPVGLNLFGGSSVGGKPYVIYVISLVSAFLLAGWKMTPKDIYLAMKLSIFGGLVNFAISLAGKYVPTIGFWSGASYSDERVVDYSKIQEAVDVGAATREGFLGTLSRNLSLWICTFKAPIKACFHPLWAPLILISIAAAAMSGFRNAVVMVGLTYFVGICYRGGFASVMIACFSGVVGLILLALVNSAFPLPPNVQRSLTFLPGTWEQRYKDDAQGSSEWRFEIWREVLTSDRWIHNKWLGDGLGFTARELRYQMSLKESGGTGISGFDMHRESILASGDYHSGPVQAVRIIGYIGLMFLLLFQIRLAVHAHRQIQRCKGSEWFPVALFFGIPLIWNPIFFVFIFGDFKSGAATLLLGSSMIRMLQNNLPLPAYAKRSRYPGTSSTRHELSDESDNSPGRLRA